MVVATAEILHGILIAFGQDRPASSAQKPTTGPPDIRVTVSCGARDVDIQCPEKRTHIGSDEVGERLLPTLPKLVQMFGKLVRDSSGVSFGKALAGSGTRNSQALEKKIEVVSTYRVKRIGVANLVSEFVGECVIEPGRENIVTWRGSDPSAFLMKKRKVLCVAIHVSYKKIEKRRLNKEFSFCGRIVGCVENSPDRIDVETPAGNSSSFVFEQRGQTKSLREVLLVNSNDATVSVESPVKPGDQKDLNAREWEQRYISC
ncbi:hypothetical protein P3T33_004596 [Rhizobium sp. AN67]|nr:MULTISPECIES: hypothetical protein [unclassified Rhizobium]MDH7809436.1 hypothetical protein [Rhizobium sp. AN67]